MSTPAEKLRAQISWSLEHNCVNEDDLSVVTQEMKKWVRENPKAAAELERRMRVDDLWNFPEVAKEGQERG